MKKTILAKRLLHFFYPQPCYYCGQLLKYEENVLCSRCLKLWQTEKEALCSQCGHSHSDCFCRITLVNLPQLHLSSYHSPVTKSLILQAKDHNLSELSCFFAKELAERIKKDRLRLSDAVICYVPRAPESILKYGTDQAEELAKVLSKILQLPLVPILRHKKAKRRFLLFRKVIRQKELTASERKKAVQDLYTLNPALIPSIQSRPVYLVDDVITTGSTVGACAHLLKKDAGASGICAISIGRS